MSKITRAGQRIGDWFLWIECEVAKTDKYRKIPVVTVRRAVIGGDILSTVVATKEMSNSLRAIADSIDSIIDSVSDDSSDCANGETK